MSVSITAFRWLDILEKEFDKAFVDLDLILCEIDSEQCELMDEGRVKLNTLSSSFAQLVHKIQTMAEANAKLEAHLVDERTQMIDIRADRQALEEQMNEWKASQLEYRMLESEGKVEEAEAMRQRWDERITKQRDELKQNFVSNIQVQELTKENEKLKTQLVNLQSEIYGSRLAAKYLDKELAGRIQQIQLLGRDLRGADHENLWNQLEAEIHLHRHKTVIRTCRGREKQNTILTMPPGHTSAALKKRQGVGDLRTIKFYKAPDEPLGLSVTGGREHGLPILISEIHPNGLAWRCGQLYVGDSILTINQHNLRDRKHAEAVHILSTVQGDVIMTVIFVAPDVSDEEELAACEGSTHLKYPLMTEETDHHSKGKDLNVLQSLTISEQTDALDSHLTENPSVIDKYVKHSRQYLPVKRVGSKD